MQRSSHGKLIDREMQNRKIKGNRGQREKERFEVMRDWKSSKGGIKQEHELYSRGMKNFHRNAQGKRDRHKKEEERGMRRELQMLLIHLCSCKVALQKTRVVVSDTERFNIVFFGVNIPKM